MIEIHGVNIPEQPKVPPMPESFLKAEYDRLYLEKCKEVNELEQRVEKFKSMAEIAVKQKRELEDRVGKLEVVIDGLKTEAIEYRDTIRRMEAEQLPFGFIPDIEPPEELPEALWDSQPVTTQDILCLSSALKNLYDIHKCDGWLLYTKLAKVLEKKIEQYAGED